MVIKQLRVAEGLPTHDYEKLTALEGRMGIEMFADYVNYLFLPKRIFGKGKQYGGKAKWSCIWHLGDWVETKLEEYWQEHKLHSFSIV